MGRVVGSVGSECCIASSVWCLVSGISIRQTGRARQWDLDPRQPGSISIKYFGLSLFAAIVGFGRWYRLPAQLARQ